MRITLLPWVEEEKLFRASALGIIIGHTENGIGY
jgi:hypothetical protein